MNIWKVLVIHPRQHVTELRNLILEIWEKTKFHGKFMAINKQLFDVVTIITFQSGVYCWKYFAPFIEKCCCHWKRIRFCWIIDLLSNSLAWDAVMLIDKLWHTHRYDVNMFMCVLIHSFDGQNHEICLLWSIITVWLSDCCLWLLHVLFTCNLTHYIRRWECLEWKWISHI